MVNSKKTKQQKISYVVKFFDMHAFNAVLRL